MGHHIRGIIGPRAALEAVRALGLPEEPRELDVGMAWVPISERMLAAATARAPSYAEADPRFERLGWGVIELCGELSMKARVAYVETEYFGTVGQQLATVFGEGRRTLETGTVNEALRAIGVVARAEQDEWDTVGLANYRVMPDE